MAVLGFDTHLQARRGPCVLFENEVTATNILTGGTSAGFYPANVLSDDSFSGWTPAATGYPWIGGIFDKPRNVNCACIAAHNLADVGANLVFNYWNAAGSFWGALTPVLQVVDNSPIFAIWADDASIDGVRVFLWPYEGAPLPFIGVFRAGKLVEFPTDIADDYTPANFAQTVELYQPAARSGAFFAPYAKRGGGVMRPPLNPMPRGWVNANIDPFRAHYDEGKPFFWAGSPAMMPKDVDLVRRAEGAGELRPRYHGGAQLASVTMELDCLGF